MLPSQIPSHPLGRPLAAERYIHRFSCLDMEMENALQLEIGFLWGSVVLALVLNPNLWFLLLSVTPHSSALSSILRSAPMAASASMSMVHD